MYARQRAAMGDGCWRSPDSITMLDVYQALEEPVIFAIGAHVDHPGCAQEQAINGALDVAMAQAAGTLLREFSQVRLSAFMPAQADTAAAAES